MSEPLPVKITRTGIWQRTLAPQEIDIDSSVRDRLRNDFIKFRERAEVLSKEISRDLPDFTVHDITHIDALWELADLIIGPDYPLTPAEAFVLGGSFLIHDLGMGLAAYPEGKEALRKNDHWKDTITYFLNKKLGRFPKKEEIDNPGGDIEDKAIEEILRILHAERAEELAFVEWKEGSDNSKRYHLIEDPEIRDIYGSIIGKIAHSHWWPVKKLDEEFQMILGAPSIFPNEWSVDPLKIACILRLADASHLDGSRAPGFLRTLRKPSKYSDEHWKFQGKLNKPRVESDRFSFTSGTPFSINDFDSWWLCYDTLRMVDRELGEVDALLADKNKPRFYVRSVAGIEDPDRLERLIPTKGWSPIDASIKVSNVSSLVYNLGGEQLYGRDNTIPLRELIQNSIDAIKARRILENRPNDWGDIIVRSGKDSETHWIEIEDNGIGMSSEVLKGPFLDFGTSYWGSQLMREEHSSLLSKGFQSIGRYGIGFFSVFMWGERVQVITRRYDHAQQDTLVLEFSGGVESRPILREAQKSEYLRDGGTRIRIWLENELQFDTPRIYYKKEINLEGICSIIAPSIEVNLYVQENNERAPRKIISASDWITLDNKELCGRLLCYSESEVTDSTNFLNAIYENIRTLKDDKNQTVARACIVPYNGNRILEGIVTVGGLYSCTLNHIVGIFMGKSNTASRNYAEPIVSIQELHRWATEQSHLVSKKYEKEDLFECASVIRALGADTGNLPIAYSEDGWKNLEEIFKYAREYDEIILLENENHYILSREYKKLKIHKNVLVAAGWIPVVLSSKGNFRWPILTEEWPRDFSFRKRTTEGGVIETLAKAWSISLMDLLSASSFSEDDVKYEREIGTGDGTPVFNTVDIIRNPKNRKT